jgi:peroxiredoxin
MILFGAALMLAAIATGPEVGSKVPDFSLPDQTGQVRRLASLGGPKGLVLVFFRSADW